MHISIHTKGCLPWIHLYSLVYYIDATHVIKTSLQIFSPIALWIQWNSFTLHQLSSGIFWCTFVISYLLRFYKFYKWTIFVTSLFWLCSRVAFLQLVVLLFVSYHLPCMYKLFMLYTRLYGYAVYLSICIACLALLL